MPGTPAVTYTIPGRNAGRTINIVILRLQRITGRTGVGSVRKKGELTVEEECDMMIAMQSLAYATIELLFRIFSIQDLESLLKG
jgi:hypothetical protein